MKKIPNNPYIVGNPIKTKDMFFGREDDFQFVTRKIGKGKANQILVFCGDRRSGKTSILFQILSGKLGEKFLPILIDMQILAGIKSDFDFFKTILEVGCNTFNIPELTMDNIAKIAKERSVEKYFEAFLIITEKKYPQKIVLFLLDEYELIEAKIKNGSLSESAILYLAGILEGSHKISFIFTGSTNLEKRRVEYWKSLLGKSIYRKISYLSQNDTYRLITEPLKEYLEYEEDLLSAIYRLTSGQPFYTQVICQNLVDILMEEERNDPTKKDLNNVVKDIVENPLPQMIYSWNNLSEWAKLILSALAGLLGGSQAWADGSHIRDFLKKSKVNLPFKRERVNILLEEAYHKEMLAKNDSQQYQYKMDLFRRWIKKEHSIWKVVREVKVELKKAVNWFYIAIAAIIPVVVILFLIIFVFRRPRDANTLEEMAKAFEASQAKVENVAIKSNYSPFRVIINDTWNLTSEGQADESVITIPSLSYGEHIFKFIYPDTGEQVEKSIDVDEDTTEILIDFKGEEMASIKGEEAGSGTQSFVLGSLFISSQPQGARILLDGEDAGVTPKVVSDIALGTHSLELVLEGYRKESFSVDIKNKELLEKDIALIATYGKLVLDVRPTAKIYIDGEYKLDTPYVKPIEIQTGRHILTMENESLRVKEEMEIVIIEGEILNIVKDLRK